MLIGIGKTIKKTTTPAGLVTGTSFSFIGFDGGIDSNMVQVVLYSQGGNAFQPDLTYEDASTIKNLIDSSTPLKMTISGVQDSYGGPPGNTSYQIQPFSWFNGEHAGATPYAWNDNGMIAIVFQFGTWQDLGITQGTSDPTGFRRLEIMTGVNWAINLA